MWEKQKFNAVTCAAVICRKQSIDNQQRWCDSASGLRPDVSTFNFNKSIFCTADTDQPTHVISLKTNGGKKQTTSAKKRLRWKINCIPIAGRTRCVIRHLFFWKRNADRNSTSQSTMKYHWWKLVRMTFCRSYQAIRPFLCQKRTS